MSSFLLPLLSLFLCLSLSLVCVCVYQRYSKNPMRNLVSNAAHTAAQRQPTRTDRHNFRFKLFLVSAPTSSSSSRRKKEKKNTIQTTRISPSLMASVGFVPLQLFTHCQRAGCMATSLSDHSSTRSDHVRPARYKGGKRERRETVASKEMRETKVDVSARSRSHGVIVGYIFTRWLNGNRPLTWRIKTRIHFWMR